ncbi:MAG: hypothetical protein A2X08_09025 [Bacteroidetes bacterium GWA2_32_17]|nr:MAG: hypothetical protein A2X08_09025 [Bacteroidetes bacterium GWA2_32_17]
MKITLNILISVLFLLSTSGIFISEHYCGNNLVSVSFFSNAKKCCDDSCPFCKNVNHTYKVKTKVVKSNNISLEINNNIISLFNLSYIEQLLLCNIYVSNIVKINPPPGKFSTTAYLSKLRL